MRFLNRVFSILIVIPFTINTANAEKVKVVLTEVELSQLQLLDISYDNNSIEIDSYEKTLSGPSELIQELRNKGFIQVEKVSTSTDCRKT